ncbi:MAG: amino acid-binding protein [Mediterranea massiliensis]|nr:amino acid-binding protein [Mediterranea massiliensis]MBO5381385.1 amino acid-binding protein [Bacteroides sp.]MBR4048665.1 amino acid-binding protein [Bacteroides sp.]
MTIKQLSVFLENKTGRINEVTKILGKHSINMHAFSMAETTDFGILRLIVSEVDKAVEILREENFAVMLTDVVCISCPNVAGALSGILEHLAEKQIFIEYMYAFAEGDKANVVIRPNDIDKCVQVLSECECELNRF